MKKFCLLLLCSLLCIEFVKSQTPAVNGKPIAEIFTDFHYIINDTSRTSGFGITRAYLGYNYLTESNFSGTVILNIGSPAELSDGAKHRRYAYFREASISWTKENLLLTFGITSTRSMLFQKKFIGKRYIADNFESIKGYTLAADLGFALDYKINDFLKADFTLMNGEGYNELQLDNNLKTSLGLNITPSEQTVIRLYGDITKPQGLWQSTLIGFLGFKNDLFTLGAETSYISNSLLIPGHHAWGASATGAFRFIKNYEVFVRYDYSTSMTVPGEVLNWNYKKDGQFAIFGLEHTFNQNFRVAIDYQGNYPYDHAAKISHAIFVNTHLKF